ncbi:hypothetical protein [Algoriphagus sp. NG3]|uniref:hypothetical protein n=1 Tax=Algoriphagus sp. NG3 TaxID=3097546 RepID=UPI002A81AFC6|nr:hypothetical protein [Algoriphagus sp. NG3]WPR77194.1 hypothetical protein SLW71_07540 [Algoriphagus sp. NG3]
MGKNSFLNYYKMILEKVSFDKHLLQKEYWKAKQVLRETEVRELDYWLKNNGLIYQVKNLPAHKEKYALAKYPTLSRELRK